MNEPTHLIYPTLSLFLYDLREGLGDDLEAIARNRHRFWRKIDPQLDKDESLLDAADRDRLAELAMREKSEAGTVELFATENKRRPLGDDRDGYLYGLQIGNAYALQVTCSGRDRGQSPDYSMKSTDILPQLKQEIVTAIDRDGKESRLSPDKQGTIGQTWLLWGQLPGNHPESFKIARECCQKLFPEDDWDAGEPRQGRFCGAAVFEFARLPVGWEDLKQEHDRLLVFLFPPRQPIEVIRGTVDLLYPQLIQLFCCLNKILWAYYGSRQIKQQLKKDYVAIEAIAKALPDRLRSESLDARELHRQLVENLELAARYSRNSTDLDARGRLIQTNAIDYQKRLEKIAKLDGDSHLELLGEFTSIAAENYRLQVEADVANLEVGKILLSDLTATLKGTIELQQLENNSDRRDDLAPELVAIGIGIAATQATSIAWVSYFSPPKMPPAIASVLAIAISLLAGIILGTIVWKSWRRF